MALDIVLFITGWRYIKGLHTRVCQTTANYKEMSYECIASARGPLEKNIKSPRARITGLSDAPSASVTSARPGWYDCTESPTPQRGATHKKLTLRQVTMQLLETYLKAPVL